MKFQRLILWTRSTSTEFYVDKLLWGMVFTAQSNLFHGCNRCQLLVKQHPAKYNLSLQNIIFQKLRIPEKRRNNNMHKNNNSSGHPLTSRGTDRDNNRKVSWYTHIYRLWLIHFTKTMDVKREEGVHACPHLLSIFGLIKPIIFFLTATQGHRERYEYSWTGSCTRKSWQPD